jgi:hypothetical protein
MRWRERVYISRMGSVVVLLDARARASDGEVLDSGLSTGVGDRGKRLTQKLG